MEGHGILCPPSKKVGGTRPPCPPTNCAHVHNNENLHAQAIVRNAGHSNDRSDWQRHAAISEEFKEFAREWKFNHITSSPCYAQSNGKAELSVKIGKSLIQKVRRDAKDIWLCLLLWRNVPTQGLDSSPCQRLMSRRTRSLLPVNSSLLKPKVIDHCLIDKKYNRIKRFYDRTSKPLRELIPGELIRMYHSGNKRWLLGKCIKMVVPRSYVVEVNGVRNRSFLRTTSEETLMYDCVWDLHVPNVPVPCAPSATSSLENSQAGLRRARTRIIKTPQRFRDYVT